MSSRIKNTLAVIAAIALLVALVNIAVPYAVDAKARQLAIETHLRTHMGLGVVISGTPHVTSFPQPKLYLQGVSVHDVAGKTIVSVPSVVIDIGWIGLLSKQATAIELRQAKVEIDQQRFTALLQEFLAPSANNIEFFKQLKITDTSIDVSDGLNDVNVIHKLRQVTGSVVLPSAQAQSAMQASLQYNGKPLQLDAVYNPIDKKLETNIYMDGSAQFTLDGAVKSTSPLKLNGTITANISDLAEIAAFFSNNTETNIVANSAVNKTSTIIPMQFTAPFFINDKGLQITRTDATINQQKSSLSAYVGWQMNTVAALELGVETLDLERWFQAFSPHLMSRITPQSNGVAALVNAPLPANTNFFLLINAESASYGKKNFKKLKIGAEFDGGDIVVHQLDALMTGESDIHLEGKVTQLPEGRRFSGIASIKGEQFNDWLADFEPSAKSLPAKDFSNFSLSGNLFVSNEQLRLSEAKLTINKFDLSGGFATYFEAMPRVEADVKLQNANLDYFRDVWREQKAKSTESNYELLLGDGSQFEWLRRIPAILDFTISIEGFRFLDEDGQFASMRLYVTPAELNLYGIDLRFPNNTLNSNIKLNVKNARPNLNVVLSANAFNTNYVVDESIPNIPWFDPTNAEKRWSEELFDLRWMNELDGGVDVSIGALTHRGNTYNNFKWKADTSNASMTIQKFAFDYLQGTFELTGTLIGGKVPGLSASFAMYNTDLHKLLLRYFNIDSIGGRTSITGIIGASGIHMKSWLEQGEMKLTTVARGVRIQNFNLQTVTDTTSQARSTADVTNGIQSNLFEGTTDLTIDGNINIKNGVMKTPGIRLVYGKSLGTLTGEAQLLPWTLNLTTNWQFPELSSSTIPSMSVSHQGDFNQFTTRIDTSLLEAFVAKRIIGQ